jgi:hypothetical protein
MDDGIDVWRIGIQALTKDEAGLAMLLTARAYEVDVCSECDVA